jgi:ATP-dependent DNA helicase RecQ
VLLYSGADVVVWKSVMEKSVAEQNLDAAVLQSAVQHLNDIDRYSRGAVCRHRALVEYFGQQYPAPSCGACDLCLGDTEAVPDAQVIAQKILSCVARVKESFGINHVVGVLRGENTEKIRKFRHDQLSTYKLLAEHGKADVRDWIYQLIGQGVLLQSADEYPVLRLNPASWEVMNGKRTVRLVRMARREQREKSKAETVSWEGVDRELFELLRVLRRTIAEERQVPPYVIFNDSTLRQLARVRPSTLEKMRAISGIGDARLRDLGARFLEAILGYCGPRKVALDQRSATGAARLAAPAAPREIKPGTRPAQAFDLFRTGAALEDVMHQTGRARSTVVDYLCEFIRRERPASLQPWLPDDRYQRIAAAARTVGTQQLKPIFLALGEQVPYDEIRLVVTHLQALTPTS